MLTPMLAFPLCQAKYLNFKGCRTTICSGKVFAVVFLYKLPLAGVPMNRMRVKCIKCGAEWEKDCEIRWGPEDFSSSLCNACFKEVISYVIHKRQLNEGNSDCFGKAHGYCDQLECRYRYWCLRTDGL